MDIDKAVKKQKKSHKRFMLAMCFIFFIVPTVLILSGRTTPFFICYMALIEAMIVIAGFGKMNSEKLSYEIYNNKIKIRNGLIGPHYTIVTDKVVLVHSDNSGVELSLFIMTSSMFRNKKIKAIDFDFLRKNAYLSHEYSKIKRLYPENNYYYIWIKRGGYNKYKLLSDIYKNCVKASYTDEAIENIKKART